MPCNIQPTYDCDKDKQRSNLIIVDAAAVSWNYHIWLFLAPEFYKIFYGDPLRPNEAFNVKNCVSQFVAVPSYIDLTIKSYDYCHVSPYFRLVLCT